MTEAEHKQLEEEFRALSQSKLILIDNLTQQQVAQLPNCKWDYDSSISFVMVDSQGLVWGAVFMKEDSVYNYYNESGIEDVPISKGCMVMSICISGYGEAAQSILAKNLSEYMKTLKNFKYIWADENVSYQRIIHDVFVEKTIAESFDDGVRRIIRYSLI